jgi:hypothetical protein
MEALNPIIEDILKLEGPQLMLVFLIMEGYLLKMLPYINNKYIPFFVVGSGGVLSPFLIAWPDYTKLSYTLRFPEVAAWIQAIFIGFLLGFAAWYIHRRWLKKWIDDKIPQWNKDGQTEMITKPNS